MLAVALVQIIFLFIARLMGLIEDVVFAFLVIVILALYNEENW